MRDREKHQIWKARNTKFVILASAALAGFLLSPSAVARAQGPGTQERLQQLEERVQGLEGQRQYPHSGGGGSAGGATDNVLFFRGGGAFLANDRGGEVFTDVYGVNGLNNGDTGWYVGAGLDLVLTKDIWGMLSKTWLLGEVGVEFKRWESKEVAQAVPTTCAVAGITACPANLSTKVQLTMLTVSFSPKIKFMEGGRLRPWIIPVGLDFHVISPPSNDTTVLDVGVQFAGGLEYRLWKELSVGADGRFHLAGGQTDTVNNYGTVGAYVGIGF